MNCVALAVFKILKNWGYKNLLPTPKKKKSYTIKVIFIYVYTYVCSKMCKAKNISYILEAS